MKDFLMTVNADELTRAAFAIEAELDQLGWDQPALLWTLHVGATRIRGHLLTTQRPLADPIGPNLFELAKIFVRGDDGADVLKRDLIVDPSFCGFAVSMEAWVLMDPSPEQLEQKERGVANADIVGAVEARSVTLVSTGGDLVSVNHTRGREPALILPEGGWVIEALALLTVGAAFAMPEGDERCDFDKLNKLPPLVRFSAGPQS